MIHNMMFGMEAYSLFWIAIAILLCILIVGTYIWLLVSWLNNRKTSTIRYVPQPHDAYEGYEQGYQPQQQAPETYQEGGQRYPYPRQQHEHPQVQYSQALSSKH